MCDIGAKMPTNRKMMKTINNKKKKKKLKKGTEKISIAKVMLWFLLPVELPMCTLDSKMLCTFSCHEKR